MERNQESKPQKGEIHSGGGGAPERKSFFEIWGVLWPILLILIGVIAFFHIIMLAEYSSTEEIDNLDYCEYTFGKGWILDTAALQSLCLFKQENGSYKMEPITKEQIESRHCIRKFYSPSYCGKKDGRSNS